jgi:hypothetical protein
MDFPVTIIVDRSENHHFLRRDRMRLPPSKSVKHPGAGTRLYAKSSITKWLPAFGLYSLQIVRVSISYPAP